MSVKTVERWFLQFNRGNINLEDDSRSGRPTEVTIDKNIKAVHRLLQEDLPVTH